MDVHQEGVGGPSSLFANGVPWNTIEVHGHAPPCAEGVAADAARCWESFLVEACGNDGGFKHFVDVAGL